MVVLNAKAIFKYNVVSEFLIDQQLPGESHLFRILNVKRQEGLTFRESMYFNFYRETFVLELTAAMGTLPSLFCSFMFWKEQQKKIKNIATMNKYINLCVLIGVPSLNFFLYSAYRRFLRTAPFSRELSDEYAHEISKKQDQ